MYSSSPNHLDSLTMALTRKTSAEIVEENRPPAPPSTPDERISAIIADQEKRTRATTKAAQTPAVGPIAVTGMTFPG